MNSHFKSGLARAVLIVLRPLLRAMIRNEVTHAEFAELARQAYVDVAYEHFTIPGRKMTYSRASVLTGLSRKEVQRLVTIRDEGEVSIKTAPNRAQRVVNGWVGDPEFLTSRGQPRVLPLHGEKRSFSALVARYSGDITLGAVLDELVRGGVVERPARHTVKLKATGYVPQDDELQKINIMAMCTADMLSTAVHNIESKPDEARLQRQVVYDDVPERVADAFREYSQQKTSDLLQDLNGFLSKETRQAAKDASAGTRLGLGIYYFENQDGIVSQQESSNEN
ncbi:MAG: hypothetical protein HKN42_17355 [Granulosicoccus sp.]|nr:hypothetical protein [Granulosicoccus sp.]